MEFSELLKFLLVGGLIGFLSLQVSCQGEDSEKNFEITTFQLEIECDEEGMISVIHTAEIIVKPGEEIIRYSLASESNFNIRSITFDKEPREWLDIEHEGNNRHSLPILIGMDASERSGTLRIIYETNLHYPSLPIENTEDLVLISKVYLRNFEKFSKKLQKDSIDIIISIPESFPSLSNQLDCNFRIVDSKSGTIRKIFHFLVLREQRLNGIKKYTAEFSLLDRGDILSDDFSSLDLEMILVSFVPFGGIIDHYRIVTNASNLNDIEVEIEVSGHAVHPSPKIPIEFLPFKNLKLDEFDLHFYYLETHEENKSRVFVNFIEDEENLAGKIFNFSLKSGIEYEDFARYRNPFYHVFSWKESFNIRNPDSFNFELIMPRNSVILEIKPENYSLEKNNGEHIEWYSTALPEEKHKTEEFLVKYIPRKNCIAVSRFLLVVAGSFFGIWQFNRRYYHFNNSFLRFLVGWSLWNFFIWLSIPTFPECFDILSFSQIPIILLYSQFYGHRTPRILRIFLALLIIILWFLPDFSKAAPDIIGYLNNLLDVKDIGSKILLGILIYLVGKYGRQAIGQFLETSRRNAIHMGTLASLVIFTILIYAWAGVRNDIYFEGKITLTLILGFFLSLCSFFDITSIQNESYTLGGVLRITNTIITREKICYCRGQISNVFLVPADPGSEGMMEGEFVWMKFSNNSGFPTFGLEFDEVKVDSEISFLGNRLTEQEISENDRGRVRDLEDLIDAVYICRTHSRNFKNDLTLGLRETMGILSKIKEKVWKF